MNNEGKIWAVISIVSLTLLVAIVAKDNNISLSSIFSSDDDSKEEIYNPSPDNDSTEEIYNSSSEPDPISQDCLDHEGLARHDHVTLKIYIDGEQELIPDNVGRMTEICNQDGEEMHSVHTHDSTGKLHIESNQNIDIPIGVFFDIWGHHFDETGIFDYRVDSTHELVMTVGGVVIDDYDDYLLVNTNDIIEIHYQEK